MNIQSIPSHVNYSILQSPVSKEPPKPSSMDVVSQVPLKEIVISPEKIKELLSLMMSAPDLVRNKTGNLLDLRV